MTPTPTSRDVERAREIAKRYCYDPDLVREFAQALATARAEGVAEGQREERERAKKEIAARLVEAADKMTALTIAAIESDLCQTCGHSVVWHRLDGACHGLTVVCQDGCKAFVAIRGGRDGA